MPLIQHVRLKRHYIASMYIYKKKHAKFLPNNTKVDPYSLTMKTYIALFKLYTEIRLRKRCRLKWDKYRNHLHSESGCHLQYGVKVVAVRAAVAQLSVIEDA